MGGESAYAQYVKHLEKSSPVVQATKTDGTVEYFAQGYQDYLQNPLQVRPSVTNCTLFRACADCMNHKAADGQFAINHIPNIRTGSRKVPQL
jgi:hypothetical protein